MEPMSGKLFKVEQEVAPEKAGLVPVKRDLTAKEISDEQIRLYSPCGCGSGKKLKFCCRQKAIDRLTAIIAEELEKAKSPPPPQEARHDEK